MHPNAQKQIMGQIKDFPGQIIVSTHSPHVVAKAAEENLSIIRMLYKAAGSVGVGAVPSGLNSEFIRKIQRQIVQTRGELLFSRAWILFEGETEAQAFPIFFKRFFGKSPYEMGVDLIAIEGGGNYAPFICIARELNIPWFIFSDGEAAIIKSLYKVVAENTHYTGDIKKHPSLFILPDGNDYESFLLNSGYEEACKAAITSVEGATFIDSQIQKKNGTVKRRSATDDKCNKCNQQIYVGEIRDYTGVDKYKRYIADLLEDSKNKTKYAEPIALEILKQTAPMDIPSIIRELYIKVKLNVFPGDSP